MNQAPEQASEGKKVDVKTIESIIADGIRIPPMPDVLVQLEYVYLDPNSEARKFANIISRDAMLAGAMFRVSSSPIFSVGVNKVDSVERAVTIVGTKNTMAVVRSESLRKALADERNTQLIDSLWRRQMAIAELSVQAAKLARIRTVRPDQLYLLGIFHDCGAALISQQFPEYGATLVKSDIWPNLPALDAQFDTDHTIVGELLARNWQLPAELTQAIRMHHDTNLAEVPDSVRAMVMLLQFATHLHNSRTGDDDTDWEIWRGPVATFLGKDEEGLAELEAELQETP